MPDGTMLCDGCGHPRSAHSSRFGLPCAAERCYCPFFTSAQAEAEYREFIEQSGMST